MVRDRSPNASAACRKVMRVKSPGEKLIGVWIWEYVLKYTSDLSLVRELAESLAFPRDVPRLKQMILIKELSLLVSKDLDIKKTLDILEALHHAFENESVDEAEADLEDVALSKRFKASSCSAPQPEVRVRGLRDDAGEDSVWKGLQQPTLELKEMLTLSASEKVDAQNAKAIDDKLSALVKNAWGMFGPVFLEKTEAAVINGKYKPQGVSLCLPPASACGHNMVSENGVNSRNEDLPQSAGGLEAARQALADRCAEFKELVKDPLPALLRKPDGGPETTTPGTKRKQIAEPAMKRSLLEPHPSAQAHCWEEDDELPETPSRSSPSASRRIHLPPIYSRKRMTGESSFPTTTSWVKQRRQMKKWSEEEVEVLKREVRKYGKGRWKMILQSNLDVFKGRTEVDIKDKWRNLEKYNMV